MVTARRRHSRLCRVARPVALGGSESSPALAAAAAEPGGSTPLSEEQLKSFCRDGYLVVPLTDLEPEFHGRLYDHVKEISQQNASETKGGPAVWTDLGEVYEMYQRSGTLRGALEGIVGADFIQHPHRALHHGAAPVDENGAVVYEEGAGDQQFRECSLALAAGWRVVTTSLLLADKDGNHVAVRDHLPRWVMCMYYPHATTLDMGPTAVVRGSPYFTVDRGESFPQSEDRLDPGLQPPPDTPEELTERLEQWSGISGRGTKLPPDGVDARVAAGVEMLGEPSLEQQKLTVPAGAAVFIHFDIFHRASRRIGDGAAAPWRPMFVSKAPQLARLLRAISAVVVAARRRCSSSVSPTPIRAVRCQPSRGTRTTPQLRSGRQSITG